VRLGGIGRVLASELENRVSSEVRTTVLGHMQRGGTPTAYDRNLATAFGTHAASLVVDGTFGVMVSRRNGTLTEIPLADVADRIRTVPLDHSLIASARAVGTSFGVDTFEEHMGTGESPVPA